MRSVKSPKPAKGKVAGLGPKDATGTATALELSTEFSFPQFDSIAEASENAGSEAKLLEYVNARVKRDVKQTVSNAINNGDASIGQDKILASAVSAGENWSISNARQRGTGVNAKAQALDSLLARYRSGEAISQEEFAALASQFGA